MNRSSLATAAIASSVVFTVIIFPSLSKAVADTSSRSTPLAVSGQAVVTIVDEGFEGTFPSQGWSVSGHWGKTDCEASLGTYSAWAEGAGNVECFTGLYHPNENSRLMFGPFSLSDALTATLNFDLWLWSALGDSFSWGASTDGVNFYGPSLVDDQFETIWGARALDLSAVPTLGDLRGQSQVWIAFTWQTDDFAETFQGVFVDNVRITKGIAGANTATATSTSTATPTGAMTGTNTATPTTTSTATATPMATATPTATSTATPTRTGPSGNELYLPFVMKAPTASATPTATPTPTPTSTPTATPTPTNTPGGENHPPVFPTPFQFSSSDQYYYNDLGQLIGVDTTITILTPATDPDGDTLTYSWSATNGTIEGSGLTAIWHRVISFGQVQGGTVTITVSDGRGGTDTHQIVYL